MDTVNERVAQRSERTERVSELTNERWQANGIYKFCIMSNKRTSSLCHVSIVVLARYQCELFSS